MESGNYGVKNCGKGKLGGPDTSPPVYTLGFNRSDYFPSLFLTGPVIPQGRFLTGPVISRTKQISRP